MTRKIPMRKCVVTHEKLPKKDLVRVVLTPDKNVEIDLTGRKNGRGAYLTLNKDVILKAQTNNALVTALKHPVPDAIYEALLELADES